MRTLHLHVGLPKCGSSTLQRFLLEQRAALQAVGVDYPAVSERSFGNLTPFLMTSAARPNPVFAHYNKGVTAESAEAALRAALAASTAPAAVLSAEGLMMELGRRDLSWLWAGFGRVTAHLFLRPRAPWILSNYVQGVKSGRYREDLREMLTPGTGQMWTIAASVMALSAHMRSLEQLFGTGSVRLHFLSPRFGGPVEQFLTALGLDPQLGGTPPETQNASLSAFVTCALAGLPSDRRSGEFLDDSRRVARIAARFDPFPDRGLLDGTMAAAIAAHFAQDTAAFLAMQDRITRADLEPDLSERTARAVGFAEIRATPAWSAMRAELARRGLPDPGP